MPNHITNKLTINGTEEQVNEVLNFIKIEETENSECFGIGTIDFNKITPMPKWIFQKDLGEEDRKKYGEENCWYSWSLENWGTKWNAYSQPDERNTEDTIYFQTAWSGVPDLISKLAWIFPDVTIEYSYADEDFGYNVGSYTFKDTEEVSSYIPEGGTKEAYDLALNIYQCSPEDMELYYDEETNEYKYIEE